MCIYHPRIEVHIDNKEMVHRLNKKYQLHPTIKQYHLTMEILGIITEQQLMKGYGYQVILTTPPSHIH